MIPLSINSVGNYAIGIIGKSGSGKSTLIDIISCMLKPETGEIKINNKLVDPDLIAGWQSKIAYISQKNYLMNASILENIAFGESAEKIDNEKLNEAVRYSKMNKLINEKTEGLDFIIGEDGKRVSGGQRQRIILARAIYRNAEIIIFDEATSSLDAKVEKEIFDDLRDNFKTKKTLIISTHKHELLNFCDKIINIDTVNSK